MALNKKNRLKNKKDFDLVFKKGKALRGNLFFIKFIGNELNLSRFGFVISSKVASKAVTRNEVRRTLSEATRKKWAQIVRGLDVVVVITAKMNKEQQDVLEAEFVKTLIKGGLLKND